MSRESEAESIVLCLHAPAADEGLGGGEAGDGNTEGRAGHIVEAHLLAEGDGGGIAAMLAANAELQLGTALAPALGGDPHELAHAFDIERNKRVNREDAAGGVFAQETGAIVTADAEG